MTLGEMIPESAVIVPSTSRDVDTAIAELAEVLARAHGLDADRVRHELRTREQLASTAVGDGVALPHGRADLSRTVAAIAIAPRGIPWETPDGVPVQIVVALLSPQQGSEHLVALAQVARALVDPSVRERLLAAEDPAQAHAVLGTVR